MQRLFTALAGASLLAIAPIVSPAMAQDAMETDDTAMSAENQAKMLEMMGQLFQAEPLTPQQEARLPMAGSVVAKMMPDGFYGRMMGDMMDSIMGPLFAMMSGPMGADSLIARQVGLGDEERPELTEDQKREIVTLLDPAADRRGEVIKTTMTAWMTDMFTALEPPMREGLSKAYAVRFTAPELGEIDAFFATPTGNKYASESMAIMADPQMMSAMMQSMPAVMETIPQMTETMEQSMGELPEERTYADLSTAERSRLAALLGMSEAELRSSMEDAARVAEEAEEAAD